MALPVFPHIHPNMRKLSIDWDDYPLVAPYTRAYPNLEWLDFSARATWRTGNTRKRWPANTTR